MNVLPSSLTGIARIVNNIFVWNKFIQKVKWKICMCCYFNSIIFVPVKVNEKQT